ncbi:MAG: hypothetical protein QXX30_01475 [Candidatus Aenigmatarchaeota archaeon]
MQKADIKLLRTQKDETITPAINEFCILDTTQKSHKTITKKGLCEEILKNYINGVSINQLSEQTSLSTSLIHKLITDFYLFFFDDDKLQELNFLENQTHLGVLYSFFNSVFNLSKEITFDAIFSKKLRQKIASSITERGFEETLNDKKLMFAWRESIKRKETLLKLATDQTNTYLNLLEKVLDRQREIAFIKAIYQTLSELDPSIAGKLYEKLEKDEYARALIETTSLEEFVDFVASVKRRSIEFVKEFSREKEQLILDAEYEEGQ